MKYLSFARNNNPLLLLLLSDSHNMIRFYIALRLNLSNEQWSSPPSPQSTSLSACIEQQWYGKKAERVVIFTHPKFPEAIKNDEGKWNEEEKNGEKEIFKNISINKK